MREGLHSLAQAHVVRQYTSEAGLAQKLQPGQALQLVGAQLGLQPGGRGYRWDSLEVREALREFAQGLAAVPYDALIQSLQAYRIDAAEPQPLGIGGTIEQVEQGRQQRFDACGRKLQPLRLGDLQHQNLLVRQVLGTVDLLCKLGKYRDQVDPPALDLDADTEVEPVAAFLYVDVEFVGLDEAQCKGIVLLDDPAFGTQRNQFLIEELLPQPCRFTRMSGGQEERRPRGVGSGPGLESEREHTMQRPDLAVGVAHDSRHPSGIAHLCDRIEWQADAPARIVELHLQHMDQLSPGSFAEAIGSQPQHRGRAQITQFL